MKIFAKVLIVLVLFVLSFQYSAHAQYAPEMIQKFHKAIDVDKDGLVASMELKLGTSPDSYDTDGDRFSDGEELYDLGTDPLIYNDDVFTLDEIAHGDDIRILSLEDNVTVVGDSVFLKGVTSLKESFVEIELVSSIQPDVSEKYTLSTDFRGVFHKNTSLQAFCDLEQEYTPISIVHGEDVLLQFDLECRDAPISELFHDMKFAGESVALQGESRHFTLSQDDEVSVFGKLKQGITAHTSFSSIVYSCSFLADEGDEDVIFRPHRHLEPGKHTFTLVLENKEKNEIYAPIQIEFSYLQSFQYLSAYLYYNHLALILSLVLGVGGGVFLRFYRKKLIKEKILSQ